MTKAPKKPAAKKTAKKAATAPTVITDAEAALVAKYKHIDVQPGSYRTSGGRGPEWGHKHTVIITCKLCEKPRVIATSDAQWPSSATCKPCGVIVRKNRKATEKVKKAQ